MSPRGQMDRAEISRPGSKKCSASTIDINFYGMAMATLGLWEFFGAWDSLATARSLKRATDMRFSTLTYFMAYVLCLE